MASPSPVPPGRAEPENAWNRCSRARGGKPGPHKIQGLGANFIPGVLDRSLLDGVLDIEDEAAYDFARRAAREEGLLVGISTGAALAGVSKILEDAPKGARILTFCYDTGERYLSVDGLF